MVAQQRDQLAAAAQIDGPLQYAPAVRPPVDIFTQDDDDILSGQDSPGLRPLQPMLGLQAIVLRRADIGREPESQSPHLLDQRL